MKKPALQDLDGRWDGTGGPILVEVKKTSSMRDVRDMVLMMLQALDEEPRKVQAVGVLTETRLSKTRVLDELQAIRSLVRPDLRDRVHCLLHAQDGTFTGSMEHENSEFYSWLQELIASEMRSAGHGSGGAKDVFPARHAVVATLVAHRLWAHDPTPMRIGALQRIAGVSYPTVAAALQDLREKRLLEEVGTAVRLRMPEQRELMQIAREHAAVRASEYFVDPTGMETPQRLQKLWLNRQLAGAMSEGVRIGGVAGAAHHFEFLDISAPPRLDFAVQGNNSSFVRRLNAGLVPRTNPTQKVLLAVHHTWDPFFIESLNAGSMGARYATPLECLADLIELGYTREAEEMAHHMIEEVPSGQP